MLPAVVFLTLITVIFSGITTIPFSIGLLAISAVLCQKSWVFFLALGLGLFLDLITLRVLGGSSLALVVFAFMVFLYKRKFETQTAIFVFLSTFLGSLIYLKIFDYQQILWQALINSLLTVIVFKLLWLRLAPPSETI
jgi:hypothetical protein